MVEQKEVLDLDGIPVTRDHRLKPQTGYMPAHSSEYLDKLTAAMCKAKPEIKTIVKNAKGNYGKYASLDEVIDATLKPLAEHGLDLNSQTIVVGEQEWLVTTLKHTSGQFMRATNVIRANPTKPQEMLSWATYYRRLHFSCLCGVAADSDNDGAGLNGATPPAVNPVMGMARQALRNAKTEQDRNTVIAKAALSVAAGRLSEEQMLALKDERENLSPIVEVKRAD